jgi:signal transduction histidine kinase
MSHELRTPLNSIIGFTSRLVRKADENNFDKRTLDSLDTIERNGQHLLELINDILDVSKIEAGEMVLHVDTIQVRDVVDEVSKKIAPLLSTKAIDYRVQIDDAVEELQADQRRLEQILLNLLSNALKFTEQGSITLEVMPELRHQQAGLRFSVTDTGIGISSEDQQRLFQRFSQIDSRVTKTVEGSGLGLVLVKEFTEIHGGEVEVHSQLGKGSQFGVWLPLVVHLSQ